MFHSIRSLRVIAALAATATLGLFTLTAQVQAQSCVQYPTRNIVNPVLYGPGFPNGQGLAASGSTLFAGQAIDPLLGPNVWMMEQVEGEWVVQGHLFPWDGGPSLGRHIATEADVLMISGSERVYVFRKKGTEWIPEQILTAPDGAAGDNFGSSIAISSDVAVIGAPDDDQGVLVNSGSAYIYHFNGASWVYWQKLTPGVVANTYFGKSVSIEGNVIAITRFNRCTIYEYINQAFWVETAFFNGYGADAQVKDGKVFAGGSSMVGILEKQGATWALVDSLSGSDTESLDGFGGKIVIADDVIVVTAPWKLDGVYEPGYLGAAYVFSNTENGWLEARKLLPSFYGGWQEKIAESAVIAGESVIFGSPSMTMLLANGYFGSIFEFKLDECNASPTPDACERPDCDHSGVPDDCELFSGVASDCNANSIPDHCEMAMSYQLDDGTPEMAYGFQTFAAPGREVVYLNQFTVMPGQEFIDLVSFPWSTFYFPGLPVTIAIFDDPNNDGLPGDATLLNSKDIISGYDDQMPHLIQANSRHQIPRTFVGVPGDSFFIGVNLWMGYESYPFIVDANGPAQARSWVAVAPWPTEIFDLGDFQTSILHPQRNLMIRAGAMDCNGNGVWDACDIAQGFSMDANANDTPDECEIFSCVSDITPRSGNGQVDIDDLLLVIESWGTCPSPSECAADIVPLPNGNQSVDVDDLLAVINAWGPCE